MKFPKEPQLVIVLGGDGTLLSAARAVARPRDPDFSGELRRPRFSDRDHAGSALSRTGASASGRTARGAAAHAARESGARRKHREIVRSAERRRDHQNRNRAHDRGGGLRRFAISEQLQSRRTNHRHSHRFDGVFVVGGRADCISRRCRFVHHARLSAHADQSAGAGSRYKRDRDRLPRAGSTRHFSPWMDRWASRCCATIMSSAGVRRTASI